MSLLAFLSLALAFFCAGIMNTLAGGGSFLTLPALLLTGIDARAANITSTIALFPMQVSTGYAGRRLAGGTASLSLRAFIIISFIGGVLGAILLLLTPSAFFARLVPWLILFATVLFAYGSFIKKPAGLEGKHSLGRHGAACVQFCIAVYGGYFGGGIGFLMLAALTLAGMGIRQAGATKNILAAIMNAAAVLVFLFAPGVGWWQVAVGIVFSLCGGWVGMQMLHKVNERILRMGIVALGLALTVAMFARA